MGNIKMWRTHTESVATTRRGDDLGGAASAHDEKARDRWGLGVTPCLGEEPRGRWRLLHSFDQQANFPHRVDVSAEWAMDEFQFDAGRDLVDDGVVAEIGADSPEVLSRDPVVDPAAPGGLEQWVAQEE